jgi:DivIVA domain-containing protein
VNGDEVRNVRFRPSVGGYDASQVDDLLLRIAEELDAGRPAGPLIANATLQPAGLGLRSRRGYDIDAVDRFLDQLARREDPTEPTGTTADPWRDLATVNHFTGRGASGLADRAAAPSRRTRRKYENRDLEYLGQEYVDAWRDFGQQPGTHLRWMRAGTVRRELRTAEQQTIASLRYGLPSTISTGGRIFTWKRVTRSSWPGVAEIVRRSRRESGNAHLVAGSGPREKALNEGYGHAAHVVLRLRELLDKTGTPILYASGEHLAERPEACITFPDQRLLRFPVRGTTRADAIMTAVDEGGNNVARYRIARWGHVEKYFFRAGAVEITIHPDRKLTDELILAIAISAPWLSGYFNPGGGG